MEQHGGGYTAGCFRCVLSWLFTSFSHLTAFNPTIEGIQSTVAKNRNKGYSDLKHIVRHNQATLKDKSYHAIYDVLFRAAVNEQSNATNAKTTSTRTLVENKLSSIASTLRTTVECGAAVLKASTARAVLDHVIDTICYETGEVCEPIGADYAKCMRAILSHQPHVELMNQVLEGRTGKEWDRIAAFCIGFIQSHAIDDGSLPESELFSTAGSSTNGPSYRSSRSTFRESAASQGSRAAVRLVTDELIACVRLLTAVPNAPLQKQAESLLSTLVEHLRSSNTATRSHLDLFTAVNQLLSWTRTEDTQLTQKVTAPLLRLIKVNWSAKSPALPQMTTTVLLLRPYIFHALNQADSLVLLPEISGLLQIMQSEYANRLERDQLGIDDLRLGINSGNDVEAGKISTTLFSLRCSGSRSESGWLAPGLRSEPNWLLIHMLASLYSIMMRNLPNDAESDGDDAAMHADQNGDLQPPRKRQRRNGHQDLDDFANLLDATTSGTTRSRACALQILAFLAQRTPLTSKQMIPALDSLTISCGEEASNLSSWALLALASCASQASASNTKLTSRWTAAWQLACRALGNASTCRAASYALYLMLHLRLVPQSSIVDLVQTATNAMDLSGPSSLSDSVALLLTAILRFSQQVNSESASATKDSILRWLAHSFTPSRVEDKQYNSGTMLYEVADIIPLIALCLGRKPHTFKAAGFPVWGPTARAWLYCEQQKDLVAYLLLNSVDSPVSNPALHQPQVVALEDSTSARGLSSEAIVLTHMLAEVTRVNEAWAALFKERARNPSHDSFAMLCKACHVFACIASCIEFRDARRQSQLQEQAAIMLKALTEYVGSTRCDESKADSFLSILSLAFSGLVAKQSRGEVSRPLCETLICRAITKATSLRRTASERIDDNDDAMDVDDHLNSQESRQSQTASSSTNELVNDFDVSYSFLTLRASATLYATVIVTQENETPAQASSQSVSTVITDFLLSQTVTTLLASRNVIAAFPSLGLVLGAGDVKLLLELFGDLLSKPKHYRSEVTLGTIIDVMQSTADVWTDSGNRQLYFLGLQLYEWYSTTALPQEILSRNTQDRLATLLLRLCRIDNEYPQHSEDTSARSCLSSLFDLLKRGSITVQFHLAGHISTVFDRSVLSTHAGMFEDLSESLPDDMDHVEGMAVRLLFFVKLASKWQTLLRWCVYRIFEAGSTPHAARCITELSQNLASKSPQALFKLFAPHLLFKWLAPRLSKDKQQEPTAKLPWPLGMGMPLKELPYSAFQYNSLNELLVANQSEVCAQVVMFGDQAGMDLLSNAAKMLPQGIVKSAFARSLAYAMSYDIRMSVGLPNALRDREHYVRDLVGGKEAQASLTLNQWSAIQGHFYLTTQQDDAEDRWLDRHPNYGAQLSILKEMKQYSHSARQLPDSQEPAFTSTKLCEQIDRLSRRTKDDLGWTSSRFTLAARMLLDSVDDSLGSLHSCLVIRRLRILICMAGDVALSGFALEMLIHSLRPFINDSECADDTLGILQYLFNHGREHLRSNPSFLGGTVILLILQLRRHSKSRQSSTTQESQHTATVQKMLGFQKWLVKYLAHATSDDHGPSAYDTVSKALDLLQLPGSASKDSPESTLLLFLLDQWSLSTPLCSRTDCFEAFCMLAHDFEAPKSATDDVAGDDLASVKYAQPLWEVCSRMDALPMTQEFTTWSARVLGRAYASTGIRPNVLVDADFLPKLQMPPNLAQDLQLTADSHMTIAQKWTELLFSRKRQEAGLAEHTLRKLAEIINTESNEAGVFSTLLPPEVYVAILDGTCGYEPPSADQRAYTLVKDDALRKSLQLSPSQTLEEWTTQLAITICRWAPKVTVVACLAPLLQKVSNLAIELLPSMLHILLVEEIDGKPILRSELSTAISSQLMETDPALHPKQQFWLKLLLYLRSQPYPREATKADRLRWLDVDYLAAADAGSRCAMPHCALLLAESIAPVAQTNKRTSGRASISQLFQPPVPDDLLLSIYQQLEEPDSFYGVQQPASLDNVLNRLDHEANGLRSLMFRSAQMDSHMRQTHKLADSDAVGMVHSLSALNFNSLALALLTHGLGNSAKTANDMMGAAQALQQWDIALPETSAGTGSTTFSVFQELSRASSLPQIINRLQIVLIDHAQRGMSAGSSAKISPSWYGVLANLTETEEILSSVNSDDMLSRWNVMKSRSDWMHMAKYDDIKPILSNRQTLFGVLVQNSNLQQSLHMNSKQARGFEVEALLAESRFAREHSHLQEALAATTTLSNMVPLCDSVNLAIAGVVKSETASVLWDAGETSASVKMLQDTLSMKDVGKQDLDVGSAGLRAQLAHKLAEARLEKPDIIYKSYLKPAISDLKSTKEGTEAGNVFYEFAKFCDDELQAPANIEAFNRISQLRREKEEEVEAIENAIRKSHSGTEKSELNRSRSAAIGWRDLDIVEEQRLKTIRGTYVQQSLQNYLLALAASDEHDICVLRFFALWLEYSDDADANAVVLKYLPRVPSWKFVLLMNQLMSRVGGEQSTFQTALSGLMHRIFKQHPHHSLHHLFANTKNGCPSGSEAAAVSRYEGSRRLYEPLKNERIGPYMMRVFNCDILYRDFANSSPANSTSGTKFALDNWKPSRNIRTFHSTRHNIPPITLTLPLRPSGDYNGVPTVVKFKDAGSILGGVSAPKLITAVGSDGKDYKQIFKNGRDDLRQDAIMEQVFEEVSKMLRHHKATRQRDLKIRTYKVIPLGPGAGVIEFVPNSIPLMEYLRPAHQRYHPQDMTDAKARSIIKTCDRASDDTRVKEFRRVCERIHPVLRHFFLERFDNPDEWFEKRTAYTRTTASVSILGHVIGLGDRHCSNILLDEVTGEVIHIDLGVSFEAGRVLPIPEKVPFRLTRDIVDGMGVTKTEGVFRRCCEFTMDAVRDDKDSIMTLLNVLRYDPLYNWTVSPLRAKRMQEAEETGRKAGEESELSSRKGGHDGEADRPLQVVEKKLSKMLSTPATVNELIQQAGDEVNLATLFVGWGAYF